MLVYSDKEVSISTSGPEPTLRKMVEWYYAQFMELSVARKVTNELLLELKVYSRLEEKMAAALMPENDLLHKLEGKKEEG